MYLLRSPKPKDFQDFTKLAMRSSFGVSSLPHDINLLEQKFNRVLDSFANEKVGKSESIFLFVMEDLETKKIIGISAVTAHSGIAYPRYYLKLEKDENLYRKSKGYCSHDMLYPIIETCGPSELCSLFLSRKYRGKGVGQLLSLARFIFIHLYPKHFSDQIMAVSRGFYEKDGKTSLFWNHIGRKFYPQNFATLLKQMQISPNLLGHFFPQQPIYSSLIPKIALNRFGRPHKDTMPAYHILNKRGFTFNQVVDFIDGGPKLTAVIDQLPLMNHIHKFIYEGPIKSPNLKKMHAIVSNSDFNQFKAMQIEVAIDGNQCFFDTSFARQLSVNKSDEITLYTFAKEPRPI